jgi:uncharacterized protein (TIGR00730 family)
VQTGKEVSMQHPYRAIAVFCGSRLGADPAYAAAAETLGRSLAEAGIRLVYGGGRIGLMGRIADACLAAGGVVTGVIPTFLARWEVAHTGAQQMIEVDSMHTRKARMAELADAFVMLPGGLGTLDETIEIVTWRQLRLHDKPIVLCDVAGSAAPLIAAIDAAIRAGFAEPSVRDLYAVADGAEAVLPLLATLRPGTRAAAALT